MEEYQDPNVEVARNLYNGSSLLRALGTVRAHPSTIKPGQEQNVADYFIDQFRQNGIDIKFVSKERLSEMTNDPKNLATLRDQKMYISNHLRNPENFYLLMDELAHEGAYHLLLLSYGSREEIPILDLDGPKMHSAEYMDHLPRWSLVA